MASEEIDLRPQNTNHPQILEGRATLIFVFTKAIHSQRKDGTNPAYGIPKETVAAITILYRNTKVKVRSPGFDKQEYYKGTRWLRISLSFV